MQNENPNPKPGPNRAEQARSLAANPLLRELFEQYLTDRADDLCLADPSRLYGLQRAAISYQSTADFWSYLNENIDRIAKLAPGSTPGTGRRSGTGPTGDDSPGERGRQPRATFNP